MHWSVLTVNVSFTKLTAYVVLYQTRSNIAIYQQHSCNRSKNYSLWLSLLIIWSI